MEKPIIIEAHDEKEILDRLQLLLEAQRVDLEKLEIAKEKLRDAYKLEVVI